MTTFSPYQIKYQKVLPLYMAASFKFYIYLLLSNKQYILENVFIHVCLYKRLENQLRFSVCMTCTLKTSLVFPVQIII